MYASECSVHTCDNLQHRRYGCSMATGMKCQTCTCTCDTCDPKTVGSPVTCGQPYAWGLVGTERSPKEVNRLLFFSEFAGIMFDSSAAFSNFAVYTSQT